MDSARWDRIQSLFHASADLPVSQRSTWLQNACEGDDVLLKEVLELLEQDEQELSLPDLASSLLDDPTSELPSDRFGSYRLERFLGEGGMGAVYLAKREDVGKEVAIKILRYGLLSPARRARFISEQKMLATLVHPLIAQFFDAGTLADGTPWFAMEYVEGLPITDYCRRNESSIVERLTLFRSVCEAVQYAHRRLVIHRDLKPSNILVGHDGTVKLLDFGIARQLEDADEPLDVTKTGLRPMTVAYAAPEHIRNQPAAIEVDVYSLGVVLYELLVGRLPFDLSNRSQPEAEKIVLEQEPERLSVAVRSAGVRAPRASWSELDVLCLTAMHKDSARRYSVEALIRDIDHYLKGEPLAARPDSLGYRAGKFVTRNRRALSAAAVVLLAVGTLIAFYTMQLTRARNAALAEVARTRNIEQFMLNLFDGGDKAAGPSGDLRVVALLDRGVRDARTLAADPIVQADLDATLGGVYQKLGKFDAAGPLLTSALDRRKKIGGPYSAETGDGLVTLGMLRYDQGKLPEAESLMRDGLAIEKKKLPPSDPMVARAEFDLGKVLEERGKYDEALKVLDAAVRSQEGQPPSADLAFGILSLAGVHFYLGHASQAFSFDQRALAMDREIFGNVHPRVADVLLDLGETEHDLGRLADMEKHYREALAIEESWYGKEHPDTAIAMIAVAQALGYQSAARYEEAVRYAQEGVDIQSRVLGGTHPEVAMGLNVLGTLQMRLGRLDEAEKDNKRVIEIDRAQYGDEHYLTGIAWMNLGEVYFLRNQPLSAHNAYQKALDIFVKTLPPDHNNTLVAQARLGHAMLMEHRYKEAEDRLLPAYNAALKKPPATMTRVLANLRKDLVAVYTAEKSPDKAAKFQAELAGQPEVAAPRAAQ